MGCCCGLFCLGLYLAAFAAIIKIFLKLTTGWDRSPTCLVGKTAIVTGSNTGIGFYTAQDFAKRGARVILACRDPQRAEEAKDKIVAATGNHNVVVKLVDLGSLDSVRKFAREILETEKRLDILVNNAGAGGFDYTITEDGLNLSMQINHFGPFLLTILLLDLLKKSTPSRIVNVSSDASHFANLNTADLNAQPKGRFSAARDYANTKLCNVLFTNELARKLRGSGVDVNTVQPGCVKTDFLRHMSPLQKFFTTLLTPIFAKSTDAGAQTTIFAAVSKDIEGLSGQFYGDCMKWWMPKAGRDEDLAKLVWEKSVEFVKLTPKELSSI